MHLLRAHGSDMNAGLPVSARPDFEIEDSFDVFDDEDTEDEEDEDDDFDDDLDDDFGGLMVDDEEDE